MSESFWFIDVPIAVILWGVIVLILLAYIRGGRGER